MVAHTLRPYRWQTLPTDSDASTGMLPATRRATLPALPSSPTRRRRVPTPAPVPAECTGARPDAGYRMGRWARLAMTLTVAAAAAVAISLWLAAPGAAPAVELVTVESGDTLWSIAVEYRPGSDPGSMVDDIAALNGLDGGALRVGSTLQVPVG
jgi:nucleoid-associated protein YgaU